MKSPETVGAVERLDADQSSDAFQVFLHNQRYDFALDRLSREDVVLEIGTGAGCFSKTLVDYGVDYTGIEFDPGACQSTRQKLNGRGVVVEGDAQKLPFADASFTAVICLEVLEHLPAYRKAVVEIHRCLKPGGRAVISVPYRRTGGANPLNPFHLYEPGEAELRTAFAQLFESVKVHYQYFRETAWMTFARRCHARRFLGLAGTYADLAKGLPGALSEVKIADQGKGLKITLLLVALKGLKRA